MKSVELYGRVRYAVKIEGMSRRKAARVFGIDRRTVDKMLSFSEPPGYRRTKKPKRPKLDPFVGIIDQILEDDASRPKKQRHTSKSLNVLVIPFVIGSQGSFIMTISQDLRIRLVKKVAAGMSRRQAAAHFDVSPSSAIRFWHQYETEGSVALKVRGPHKRRLDLYGDDLLNWIEETPDMTLQELSERLLSVHAIDAAKSTIDDWLRSRKISFKKNGTRQRTGTS